MAPSKPPSTGDDAGGTAGKASTSKAAARPYPIEVALADGTVLRGLEHPADGPPLLFVHDLGDDLDAWGSVAATVSSAGFRVIRLELRGHGLSDGEPDPSATMDDLTGALAEVAGAFGPAGLVAYGAAARAAFNLGTGHGAPVHALISPTPGSGDGGNLHRGDGENLHRGDGNPDSENLHRGDGNPDSENLHRGDGNPDSENLHRGDGNPDSENLHRGDGNPDSENLHRGDGNPDSENLHRGDGNPDSENLHRGDGNPEAVAAMRVLFTGAHDELTHGYARTIHPSLRGQNMWISTGTALRGPALLQEHPHLIEQLVMFMRRHLTAHHLAWIAEHGPDRQDSDT